MLISVRKMLFLWMVAVSLNLATSHCHWSFIITSAKDQGHGVTRCHGMPVLWLRLNDIVSNTYLWNTNVATKYPWNLLQDYQYLPLFAGKYSFDSSTISTMCKNRIIWPPWKRLVRLRLRLGKCYTWCILYSITFIQYTVYSIHYTVCSILCI